MRTLCFFWKINALEIRLHKLFYLILTEYIQKYTIYNQSSIKVTKKSYPFIIEPTYIPPSPPLFDCPTMLIPKKFTVSREKENKYIILTEKFKCTQDIFNL